MAILGAGRADWFFARAPCLPLATCQAAARTISMSSVAIRCLAEVEKRVLHSRRLLHNVASPREYLRRIHPTSLGGWLSLVVHEANLFWRRERPVQESCHGQISS